MTPLTSPQGSPTKVPNDEVPWPVNPLRRDAMTPKKLFEKQVKEKLDGDAMEDRDLKDRLMTYKRGESHSAK